ncbi:MAG: hypothetical protein Q7O66_16310 [Dehalococcoidia bacterium]|nr:hypothetical protein [Dehalococcoidia bacterium]
MTSSRIAMGLGVTMLFALVVGCSEPSRTLSAPKQLGPPIPPTPVATVSLANPKSVLPPKPIDPATTNGPRLSLDAESLDFGEIPYSHAVAISFNAKNVGAAPIALGPAFIRVKEGC